MKILYVTPLWSGFKDILFFGKDESCGMPAFIKPLKKLVDDGNTVDMIVAVSTASEVNIGADWLKKINIKIVVMKFGVLKSLISIIRFFFEITRLLRENNYDFLYAHGSLGVVGTIAGRLYKVPVGQRLYGTFLASEIDIYPRWLILFKHPLEYLAFTLKKNFLIITNDGTRGNLVYNYLNYRKKDIGKLFFWLNGVDLNDSLFRESDSSGKYRYYLVYPARFSRWKRQHLAVELLNKLHKRGFDDVGLLFCGHITEEIYYKEVIDLIARYGLRDYVEFKGVLNGSELNYYYKGSLAVLSFYEHSNLGNVSLEALSSGAVLMANNDGSLDDIIKKGVNGYLIDSIDEGVDILVTLLLDENLRTNIKHNAANSSKDVLQTWSLRIEREIEVIKKSIV